MELKTKYTETLFDIVIISRGRKFVWHIKHFEFNSAFLSRGAMNMSRREISKARLGTASPLSGLVQTAKSRQERRAAADFTTKLNI